MHVVRSLASAHFSDVVLTIGNFDGIHLGHQTILSVGRRRADAAKTQFVVMTFDPHPATILTPDRVPELLTPMPERTRQLLSAGADVVVVVEANAKFLSLSAGAFIRDVVMQRFRPVAMVEGDSFCYGQHRRGTVDTLRAEGRTYGFDVDIVEAIRINLGGSPGTVISSSLIRHLLKSGTVDQVAQCLGRPYVLLGKVKPGAGRGRALGFPTANLSITSQLIPPEGVYAGRAQLIDSDDKLSHSIIAAVSVGRALTFESDRLLVEAHLLDFKEDLYEQDIRLEFLGWIRDQRKFDTPKALSQQIKQDIARIREICKSTPE